MHHHSVMNTRTREDIAGANLAAVQVSQGTGGTAREIKPDGLSGRCQRGMRKRKSQGLTYYLRSGSSAEKLTTSARRGTRTAAQICGFAQGNQAVGKSSSERLHRSGVLAFVGGRVTPPGTITQGRSGRPARAIIIAGRPLSQVAIPSTPALKGSERARRRNTVAASLR